MIVPPSPLWSTKSLPPISAWPPESQPVEPGVEIAYRKMGSRFGSKFASLVV
jgi:hypothetical protein